MIFDGTDYMIDRGQVKHCISGGWSSECNLPVSSHGGPRMLDVVVDGCLGETLLCYCQDGTVFQKRHNCGWSRR